MTHVLALRPLLLCLAAALWGSCLSAATTRVAVAANFTEPARDIAAAFARATGHRAVLSFGSSGSFYAQMRQGAPFDLFLSADADRPKQAERDGLTVPGSRFTYAVGRLVLYSADPKLVDPRGAVLNRGNFDKLAIADPATAPYGSAALQTLNKLGVYPAIAPKIVKGTSIGQAYDFVATRAAPLGFVALSQVITRPGGSRWVVPQGLHAPIEQQAVELKVATGNPAAAAFLQYLRSPAARAIIRRYGYQTR
ncbi:molybdate ABC transporter substrate-binding protein [Sphingomonas sp.]|uniref:molybdate ABC transporter substrate-binding protein n=1 Tax=Sphingomonas sp. TaxID=28214 RepID=UPI003B3AB69A